MILRSRTVAATREQENPLCAFLAQNTRIRFGVSAAQFAARIIELARAAGVSAEDYARRVALDDLYLATSCASGDVAAWTECEAAHFPFIRAFARHFLHDAASQDLADQVIADLWQRGKIGRYAGRSTLRTWLGAVVSHSALNARKGSQLGVAVGSDAFREYARRNSTAKSNQRTPEDAEAERVLADLIVRAIEALNAEEKLLLQLHYEQGLTLDEMEGPLRSSKATLSRRLKRIREHVRTRIDEMAERTHGTSAAKLRERLQLDRLELDLAVLLRVATPMEGKSRDSV